MEVSAKTTSSVELVKASWNEVMGRANPARNHDVGVGPCAAEPSHVRPTVPPALWLLARNQGGVLGCPRRRTLSLHHWADCPLLSASATSPILQRFCREQKNKLLGETSAPAQASSPV